MKYLLVFILLMVFCQTHAQQTETIDPAQTKTEAYLQNIQQTGEELQEKVFTKIDSLSNKSAKLLQTTTDSLNSLGSKLTFRIDSLQSQLLNKVGKLGNSVSGISGKTGLKGKSLPGLEKLSLPDMPKLNTDKLGLNKLSIPDNGLSSITSQVDDQLGKIGDLKNTDWINPDKSGYQVPGEVKEYTELLKDPSTIDQAIDSKAAQMSEFQSLNNETKELATMKELPESMLADLKRYQDTQTMKAEAKEVVIKKATDYFAGHQDKLSQAQGMMSKLKKKYSYVPDSRDLSTAVKATSLKDEPLKKRLVFGLGFQLQRTNPISLDLSPNLLYRFNKLFSAGISGTYRASLGIENNSSVSTNTATDVYGASAIVQHKISFAKGNKILKGFFGHGEFQYLSTPIIDPNPATDLPSRSWNEGLLLGIGKQMNFSKALKGQIIFTYDFLHTSASPNPKAWNIKFGFQFGEFKGLLQK